MHKCKISFTFKLRHLESKMVAKGHGDKRLAAAIYWLYHLVITTFKRNLT